LIKNVLTIHVKNDKNAKKWKQEKSEQESELCGKRVG